MNVTKVDINTLVDKPFDIKEECPFKFKKVKDSIIKYGQLKPVIVYEDDMFFRVVSGSGTFRAMKEVGGDAIWINVIDKPTVLERIDISNLLGESVRDIDTLKFATLISDLSQDYNDEQIATKLNVQLMQVKVLKDLLNLKFTYEAKKDNSQQAFTFEL